MCLKYLLYGGKMNNEAREIGENIARELEKAVNANNYKEVMQGFAEGYLRAHPTLQQNIMRGMVEFLKVVGDQRRFTDARNQGSRQLAHRVSEFIEQDDTVLPYI